MSGAEKLFDAITEVREELIDEALDKAVKAAELIAVGEIAEAMNRYSVGKKKRARESEEV